ncbi:hypothetical protein M1O14_01735 [Dehalococcoidia bacterium]|nr:hypothetical protein [Dehalococcoidia bacterium]
MKYPHLGLLEWPFRVVPDESFYSFMADREQLVSDIRTLLRNLSRRSASSMHLMWAWFGAGKTHTLRHMEYLCRNEFTNFVPIYMEFPKGVKSFVDLYRECVARLDLDAINNAYLEVFTSPQKSRIERELSFELMDLANALKLLYMGTEEQQSIVIRWLRAECREVQTLRMANITRPIRTADEALKVLSWIIKLMSLGGAVTGEEVRVLWTIDEFQRIAQCSKGVREEINSCLNSLFNRCPNGLSVILSFSGKPEKKLPAWVSSEIADRIGIEKVMLLPPLSRSDSYRFVQDVLHHFRDPYFPTSNSLFPFSENAIEAGIDEITRRTELKPRAIMHFFDAVLEEGDLLIEKGELSEINDAFVKQVLKDRVYLEQEE